jgi:hypothetical protein
MKRMLVIPLFAPFPALAEVSDKMATIPQLWVQGLLSALILLVLVRASAWWIIPGVLAVAFFVYGAYSTFADPFMGQAVFHEQGIPYIVSAYGSAAVMGAGALVGLILNRKRWRRQRSDK